MSTPAIAGSEVVSSLTLLGKVSATLIFIIALILFCAWLFRRVGNAWIPQSASKVRVVTSANLGGKERIVVVDVEDQRLVLGVGPGSVNLLSSKPAPAASETGPEPVAPPLPPLASAFQKMFAKAQSKQSSTPKGLS